MEQQLQAEIKKNKNLLQSNFTLMQENQQYITALNELKQFIQNYANDGQNQQTICAEDAQALVTSVIKKFQQIKGQKQYLKTEDKRKNVQNRKECQCQKWKSMYTNQSQQSLRLSKRIAQLQQKINKIQQKYQLQYKQVNDILKQYLIIYQRVNSVQFLQSQKSVNLKKKKQNIKQNKNDILKSSKQKQKRSASKSKNNQHHKSQQKKLIKNLSDQDKTITTIDNVPSTVIQQLTQFTNFINYLQNLRQNYRNSLLQNKILRDEISDYEALIRIYREKQRQRLLYKNFLVE